MRKLKKLGICESEEECLTAEQMSGNVKKVVLLEHLQTFKCFFIKPWILKQCDVFPPTLKILTLRGCQLPWDQMTILCKLPKLEVLKLKDYAFQGSEWEPTDECFEQLKFLLLDGTDLITGMPVLVNSLSLRILFWRTVVACTRFLMMLPKYLLCYSLNCITVALQLMTLQIRFEKNKLAWEMMILWCGSTNSLTMNPKLALVWNLACPLYKQWGWCRGFN